MKPTLTRITKSRPSDTWTTIARSALRPGPNPTIQTWHYSDGASKLVVVGADIEHVHVTSKYNRAILGLPE